MHVKPPPPPPPPLSCHEICLAPDMQLSKVDRKEHGIRTRDSVAEQDTHKATASNGWEQQNLSPSQQHVRPTSPHAASPVPKWNSLRAQHDGSLTPALQDMDSSLLYLADPDSKIGLLEPV